MKKILTVLALLLPAISIGQQDSLFKIPVHALSWYNPVRNTDSLKQLIAAAGARAKTDLLCELAYSFLKSHPDKSRQYSMQALEISDSINYNNGRVKAYLLLSSKLNPEGNDTLRAIRYLQKAAGYFDEETHWTLKYRIWFGIGQRLSQLGKTDSAFYYYRKPLLELGEDAWLAYLGSYTWLSIEAAITGDYQAEEDYLIRISDIAMNRPDLKYFYDDSKIFGKLEKLPQFYTAHALYGKSIASSRQVIRKIDAMKTETATGLMYRAKFCNKIGRAFHSWGYYDSAIIYHNSAIELFNAVRQKFQNEILDEDLYPDHKEVEINIANQLEERAGVLIKKGQLESAKADLMQSVEMRMIHDDLLGVGMSYDKLGEIEAIKGNFQGALLLYDSAIRMKQVFYNDFYQRKGPISGNFWSAIVFESLSYTHLKLGNLYDLWKKDELANAEYKRSLAYADTISHPKRQAEALTALGENMLSRGNPDSALMCFRIVKNIYTRSDNRPGIGLAHENTGNYYLYRKMSGRALHEFGEALRIYSEFEMPIHIARIYCKLGEVNASANNNAKAISNYTEALKYARRFDLKNLKLDCHEKLAELYHQTGKMDLAYQHLLHFTLLKDEIHNLETQKQITEIETRFNTQQKEQQILLLETENELHLIRIYRTRTWLIIISIMVIVVLLWVFLYIRQNRLKNEQEKNSLQRKLLRSQMNPHFIFNALSSVQNSIINEKPALASKYLAKFSKLMRNILEGSSMELITLEQELVTIEHYLALQKIRFGEKFDFHIQMDENLDIDNILVPPMLTQPFIENAIEHGFKYCETKGMLNISFQLQEKYLLVAITDNGIGREKAAELYRKDGKDYKSMATEITRQRIKATNRRRKHKISMTIIDLKDENGIACGTSVRFQFPV